MVDYFKKILQTSFDSLHQAALVLALATFGSQLLALVRDRIFAHRFGTGFELDIYYAAFRIPDFIFVSVASLVSLSVMVPYLSRELEKNREATREFISSVFQIFCLILIIVCGLAFIFMPQVSLLVAPGLDDFALTQMVSLSRILLLSPILLGISGFLASIVQTFRKFLVYALSPIFYNLGIIIGAVFLYPTFGLNGLAYGVVLGALMHCLILIPTVSSLQMLPVFTRNFRWSAVFDVFFVSLPRTFALGVHQIVLIIFTGFASLMGVGAISVFTFAMNLQGVPLAIIGMSYATAAFPTLSSLIAKGDKEGFYGQLGRATAHIVFWSLPAVSLVIILRAQIVRVILGSGSFDWTSTRLVAAGLALFAFSTVAQGLVLLFTRASYAKGDTRFPMFVNIFSGICMIVGARVLIYLLSSNDSFRFFLESLLRVNDVPGVVVLALPLAYSLGMGIAMFVYIIKFWRDSAFHAGELWRIATHSFYSAVVMGFVAYQALNLLDRIFDINTLPGIFMQGFLAGILAIIAGIILLRILGSIEYAEVALAVRRRFWETKPVLPPPEETTIQ